MLKISHSNEEVQEIFQNDPAFYSAAKGYLDGVYEKPSRQFDDGDEVYSIAGTDRNWIVGHYIVDADGTPIVYILCDQKGDNYLSHWSLIRKIDKRYNSYIKELESPEFFQYTFSETIAAIVVMYYQTDWQISNFPLNQELIKPILRYEYVNSPIIVEFKDNNNTLEGIDRFLVGGDFISSIVKYVGSDDFTKLSPDQQHAITDMRIFFVEAKASSTII